MSSAEVKECIQSMILNRTLNICIQLQVKSGRGASVFKQHSSRSLEGNNKCE